MAVGDSDMAETPTITGVISCDLLRLARQPVPYSPRSSESINSLVVMMLPIQVWLTPTTPNPWKVVLILDELGVPYEIEAFRFDDIKKEPFIKLNPNGSVPAIVDPNTNVTLWESGAIITYIIEQYDKDMTLAYSNERLGDKHALNQWLHFQMSLQGPFFHQAGWFNFLHPEKIPSRQLAVLDGVLEGREWLVGEKITYADLAFVPWNDILHQCIPMPEEDRFINFPNVKAWHERMTSRPSWQKLGQARKEAMEKQDLNWTGMPRGIKSYNEYLEKIAKGEDTRAQH
ncbi:glutathione S-transferase [Xylaria bambusicola]|uniref:glutathione S-transferase n=1 Tax=Xylaria bambusicola TaxID=326684 RepID=UPI0020081A9B|nr:glutathione S-transferase [Xylaria bambusicola]KAI0521185.1 glutathione S-transferase [Xylaria bambusicola]